MLLDISFQMGIMSYLDNYFFFILNDKMKCDNKMKTIDKVLIKCKRKKTEPYIHTQGSKLFLGPTRPVGRVV